MRPILNETRIVFLDRDGVINKYPGDLDYIKSPSEFHFLPKAKEGLKRLSDSGFKIVVISNQAGVSKGIYTQESLNLITQNMLSELSASKADIYEVYYCTHRQEDNCPCRKPKTGLIEKAVARLKDEGLVADLKHSFFIGDTVRDIETGKAAGLKTILVFSGKEKPGNADKWQILPDYTAADLSEAADFILNLSE